MDFTCNVCGTAASNVPVENIDRETPSCSACQSSVRMRSIVHLLSVALFGRSIALPDFPKSPGIVGVGLSDWVGYADRLATKFKYTNSYYHQEPRLDIAAPAQNWRATCDFLISTDVFEHVSIPVSRAFQGAFDVLKPGGHFILTVPFTNEANTVEHFPDMDDYRIVQFGEEYVLLNRAADGRFSVYQNLVFHGGAGTTLEMRVFCRKDVEKHLRDAGFTNIHVMGEDVPEWGILHKHPWSLPIVARRP